MSIRPAVPLSVQLLLTFVGLLLGMTWVLMSSANNSLLWNLETEAKRTINVATKAREQTLTQLFELRQHRALGMLVSLESLCAEPLESGRLGWVDDCVRTMVDDFRVSERALGATLSYGRRRLRRSGAPVPTATVPPGSLARVIRAPNGDTEYIMTATRRQATLMLRFDSQQVADLFDDQSSLGRTGEVFLVDHSGQFLIPARHDRPGPPAERAAEFLERCNTASDAKVNEADYRGVKTIESFRPIPALGGACVVARMDHQETVAPAQRMRAELLTRSAWFVVVGVILSLIAAQWISLPVRRLAVSARTLQTGRFDRPLRLAGPSEVRALGRAFNVMANHLAELVAKEQAARREAEAANQAKDEFLARVSHELRTPLTAVLGWAQMLQSERLPPEQARHALAVIERSARAQRQLIEDLLDVSRIVSNRLRIAREAVPLAAVIDQALDAVRPEAAARRIQIESVLAEPGLVLGDARRLEQVVWNLTWNAVKFTQPSGKVTVRLVREGGYLVLSVADTGVGIPSAFLPHVFEWFRQADPAARSQAGLGLGLGIVRHLVQLHGGSVRAESRGEGRGATFVVRLPLHQPAAPMMVLPAETATPTPLSALKDRLSAVRVLVVEDDEDTRELVRATLEHAGAQVETVGSASEARREMLEESPDVLVSDIRMPEEDGYSLIQSLRTAGVTTPAIALTANARREDAEEARTAGFQIHLAKPIDAARLVEAVATLHEQRTIH
jgi:signal transduction histidine kinase/ActR/RegA family two-component response regulator